VIKNKIENWFITKVREYTLYPENTKVTFLYIVEEYNQQYVKNNIQEERVFNPIVFSYLFTKIRTIGFSNKLIMNEEFIRYRELLIKELNCYNREVALDFIKILSNESIKQYSKEIYCIVYIIFSHFVEIYNNLHQYKETTINTNIRIAQSYMNSIEQNMEDNSFKKSMQNVFDFLKLLINNYKEHLTIAST